MVFKPPYLLGKKYLQTILSKKALKPVEELRLFNLHRVSDVVAAGNPRMARRVPRSNINVVAAGTAWSVIGADKVQLGPRKRFASKKYARARKF